MYFSEWSLTWRQILFLLLSLHFCLTANKQTEFETDACKNSEDSSGSVNQTDVAEGNGSIC